jgi:enoyl-CoA hydratase/carnithine racemase
MNTIEIEHPRPEVAILRLNRPKSLNALSWELVEDLHARSTRSTATTAAASSC